MTQDLCPCNSLKDYHQCCALVHQRHEAAIDPEQLMRARYSAHVLGLVDFVVNTYHPSCQAVQHRQQISEFIHNQWLKLNVISSHIDKCNRQGFVEFKAYYLEQGREVCLYETSRFIKEQKDNQVYWYYIDGHFPVKLNRNDLCYCESGKKFKKCCG